MEALILLLVVVLLVVPLVALAMAGTSLSRIKHLRQQLTVADGWVMELRHSHAQLREHVLSLEQRLGELSVEAPEPEAPVIREPEAPVIREPEAPVIREPEAPVIREPEAPAIREPEVGEPEVGEPEVGEPEVGAREVGVEDPRTRVSILEELQAARTGSAQAPEQHDAQPVAPPRTDGGWEQWLGIRGAAALGAGVLVLAGLYFFKYSIEHDLINETMRVVLGTLTGTAALVAAEAGLRRRHALLANCMSGAGIAILYLTFWAAVARYGVISSAVAGALMVLVTASCCVLSIKRRSGAIALFGLLGGFATPLLLSTGSDHPVALFSYLLLLDIALLYVARVRRWPMLAFGSLLGTACYQGLWIVGRMGVERLGWGMLLCLLFAGLFAVTTSQGARSAGETQHSHWALSRMTAALLPFLFALYFGLHADFGERFYPLAAYIGVLVIGAGAMARRDQTPWLGLASSCAALGVMAAWLMVHGVGAVAIVSWEIAGFSAAVALFMQGLAELERRSDALRVETSLAVVVWALGSMLITAVAVAASSALLSPWPWLIGWGLAGLALVRHACISRWPSSHLATALAVGVALLMLSVGQIARNGDPMTLVGAAIGMAVMFQLAWLLPRKSRHFASHAAALLPLMLLFALPSAAGLAMFNYQAAALLLLLLIGFATVRNRSMTWLSGALVLLAMVQWWRWQGLVYPNGAELELAYGAHALGAVLVGCWPLLLDLDARNRRWTWRAAALAGPTMFIPMLALHQQLYGDGFVAVLPLALGAFGLLQLWMLRRRGPSNAGVRHSGIVWLSACALGFVTAAIPLQLENEWITIGWSLLGVALLWLWSRRDHAGLKYSALALFTAVAVRLVSNPYVLNYHPRGSLRVFNWISYTYLIPVACMAAGVWLLIRYADDRLRDWEPRRAGRDITASVLGMAAIVVGFAWINLTIIDWFAVGRMLELSFQRLPARNLTMSLAWALYALTLLAAGVWRKSTGLRKLSLVLLIATCGKVFLHDLSHLADLYRVMSLVGLALSLMMVSYAYQRFVFAHKEQAS